MCCPPTHVVAAPLLCWQQLCLCWQPLSCVGSPSLLFGAAPLLCGAAPLLVFGQYNKRYFPGRQTADILSLVQVDAVVTNEQVLAVQKLKNSNEQLRKRLKLLGGKEEDAGGSTELALLQQELGFRV